MGMEPVAAIARETIRIDPSANPIEGITNQRRTDGGCMNPDLVGATRGDRHSHQTGVLASLQEGHGAV
jgi:hypothetical protein